MSPYCVTLQAKEIIRGKSFSENATVCIFTNQTSVAAGVEFLPEPEKLRDDRNRRAKSSSQATSAEMKAASLTNFIVQFPDEVEVFQNATNFARILEPTQTVTDNKIR